MWLKTKRIFGRNIIYYDTIGSTQEVAKKLAIEGFPEGTIVVAKKQTSGYGRRGRRWYSNPGGLWLSLILCPKIYTNTFSRRITFLTSLAVIKTIKKLFGITAKRELPNDIVINDGLRRKKICGILTEVIQYSSGRAMPTTRDTVKLVVIGVGMNVQNKIPPSLHSVATSLKEVTKKEVSLRKVFVEFLLQLEKQYLKDKIVRKL